MKKKTWFEKMLDTVKDSFEFRFETIILDITEQIAKRMKERQINRTQLAKALDVSPAAVTKILNGNSNFTLRTLLTIGDALDLDLAIKFRPKETSAEAQRFLETCVAWAEYRSIPTTTTMLTATSSVALPTSITADLGFNQFGVSGQQRDIAET
jgi:transcriptional regulator with XRE-family HTH domain